MALVLSHPFSKGSLLSPLELFRIRKGDCVMGLGRSGSHCVFLSVFKILKGMETNPGPYAYQYNYNQCSTGYLQKNFFTITIYTFPK